MLTALQLWSRRQRATTRDSGRCPTITLGHPKAAHASTRHLAGVPTRQRGRSSGAGVFLADRRPRPAIDRQSQGCRRRIRGVGAELLGNHPRSRYRAMYGAAHPRGEGLRCGHQPSSAVGASVFAASMHSLSMILKCPGLGQGCSWRRRRHERANGASDGEETRRDAHRHMPPSPAEYLTIRADGNDDDRNEPEP